MRNRPWPLVILALIQVYTPLVSIFFNAWVLGVGPGKVMGWVMERGYFEAFQTLALMPIAGVAIWAMKPWSYPVSFAAILWAAIRNFQRLDYASGVMSATMIVAVYAFQLALVVYLLLPRVRRTYFDPSVRWWESKPRYVLKLAAVVRAGGRERQVSMLNLSEGGAFVSAQGELANDQKADLSFEILGQTFQVAGHVVHSRKMDDGRTCFGLRFEHTKDSARRFQRLAAALAELDFQDRGRNLRLIESLRDWLGTFVKTGRGLLPDPQGRANERKRKKTA
jgi:hypothetical protein